MRRDVLVIGGGPAGSAAAFALACAGARVAVLERTDFGGRRVGELAAPEIAGSLQSMGLWAAFRAGGHRPAPRLMTSWGAAEPEVKDFLISPFGAAWLADRRRLDRLLFDAAAGAGAATFLGAAARRSRRCGGVWMVDAVHNGRAQTFEARYIVDATGRTRGVRAGGRAAADRLVACCCYIEQAPGASSANMPLVEAAEDGWWFSAALPDGTLLVAYLTDADLLPSSSALMVTRFWRLLERAPFTRQQLPDIPTRHCFRRCAADSQWRPTREPNRLAAGDAMMALDPLCGRGIVAAIESGRGAANALLRCDGGDVAALEAWQMAQRRVYERYLNERDAQYEAERRWPQSTFWRRRSRAGERFDAHEEETRRSRPVANEQSIPMRRAAFRDSGRA